MKWKIRPTNMEPHQGFKDCAYPQSIHNYCHDLNKDLDFDLNLDNDLEMTSN